MMEFNEFLKKLQENGINLRKPSEKGYRKSGYVSVMSKEDVSDNEDIVIYWEWCTGGITGGNCWSEGGHRSYVSDDEERSELDRVLEIFYPNITFLEYRNLDLAHRGSYSEYEYYGNSTDYAFKYVKVKDLYDWLIKKNVI